MSNETMQKQNREVQRHRYQAIPHEHLRMMQQQHTQTRPPEHQVYLQQEVHQTQTSTALYMFSLDRSTATWR